MNADRLVFMLAHLDHWWTRYAERVHKLRPAGGEIVALNGTPARHLTFNEIDDAIAQIKHALREELRDDDVLNSVTRRWPAPRQAIAEQVVA